MRWCVFAVLLGIGAVTVVSAQSAPSKAQKKTFRDSFRTAPDGVTRGWLVEEPVPNATDDPSQDWRRYSWRLVIARHGKVIRRVKSDQSFWSWNFWNRGREVVVQEGPLHGQSSFRRIDLRSGKDLEEWNGDVDDPKVPAWVKAAAADSKG